MRNPFFLALSLVFFALTANAQEVVLLDSVSSRSYTPKELGAKHFIPVSSAATNWVATIGITSESRDRLLLFKHVDKACINQKANAFKELTIEFDSTTSRYNWTIELYALNQFDVDKLPFLPPAIYILHLTEHTAIKSKTFIVRGDPIIFSKDTFEINYGTVGHVIRLDGPMGSSYKSKRRKMEREFVFSTKGTPFRWSYKNWYVSRKGIYANLKEPIGEWILYGMGYNWWEEGALLLHEEEE